jgi:hypothetical protein
MTYAFPHNTVVVDKDGGIIEHHKGMTLRDYFAAKAMHKVNMNNYSTMSSESYEEYIARHAYKMADAMLKAREA